MWLVYEIIFFVLLTSVCYFKLAKSIIRYKKESLVISVLKALPFSIVLLMCAFCLYAALTIFIPSTYGDGPHAGYAVMLLMAVLLLPISFVGCVGYFYKNRFVSVIGGMRRFLKSFAASIVVFIAFSITYIVPMVIIGVISDHRHEIEEREHKKRVEVAIQKALAIDKDYIKHHDAISRAAEKSEQESNLDKDFGPKPRN